MKTLKLRTRDLLEGLKEVGHFKGNSDIAKSFTIKVAGEKCEITRLDYNSTIITYEADNVYHNEDQVITIDNYKNVEKEIKFMEGKTITITSEAEKTTLSDGTKSINLNSIDNYDYALVKEFKERQSYNTTKLLDRIMKVDYATDKAESRRGLEGIVFKGDIIFAVDGYRLAVSKDDELNIKNTISVSKSGWETLKRMLRKNKDQELSISIADDIVEFRTEKTILQSKLLNNEPLDISKILRDSHDESIKVDRDQFLDNLKYLTALNTSTGRQKATPEGNILAIENKGNDKLKLTHKNAEGEYTAINETSSHALDYKIGVNLHYMHEAINKIKTQTVKVGLAGAHNPIILETEKGDELHLVMPVRSKNE